ncbi:MAG TPA: DUF222 domain-containing protein [Trebonia sp.]
MEPDYDPDAYLDWLIAHDEPPQDEVWLPPGDGDMVATPPVDPADDGFAQGAADDTMEPGPLLCARAYTAADRPRSLSDDELLGGITAAGRIAAHAEWMALRQVAEFSRRQEIRCEESAGRGDPALRRQGEFGAEELAFQLGITRQAAGVRIDQARNLDDRLPETFTRLRDGAISPVKAWHIHRFTAPLSDAGAAEADKILAEAAPGLSENGTYGKARRVCYKLDPETFDRMREDAAHHDQRMEVRQEDSGNTRVAMREMPVEDAAALNADIDAGARRLKRAGLDAPLRQIRYWISRDRAFGLDPWDRLALPSIPGDETGDDEPGTPEPFAPDDGYRDDDEYGRPDEDRDRQDGEDKDEGDEPADGGRGKAPVPGLVNILVPAGTLAGLSSTPGEAGGLGFLDRRQARSLVKAASLHPVTRWCVTEVGDQGEAVAHGCARGRHTWKPPPPGATAGERLEHLEAFLRELGVRAEPIASGGCGHRHKENRYRPSRTLAHLIRARTSTCPGPGCAAQAQHSELDHTEPWPRGDTCECNLSPPCTRHHHAKHAPGWRLEQPEPGVMRWTTPSGRTFTTRSTRYDL